MNAPHVPSVVLAAGTATGAGTTVALVEACRTLARQLSDGHISAAEVRLPVEATEARAAAVGCTVVTQNRWEAIAAELIDRSNADVYIGFADRLPINRRTDATRVMVIQNPHLYEPSDAPSLGEVGRKVRTWWASQSATSADLIVCATNASRDAVRDAVGGLSQTRMDVRPIRPATPPPRESQSATIGRFALLGDLYSYKRFDVALDGITEWAANRSGSGAVEVVHCGRPRDEKAADDFAAAIARAESVGVEVIQRGAVDHGAAMDELLAADVLVSASEVETQGLTILEAMAVGVPVIARSIGPVEDLAGDAVASFSVDGGASEIAAAIELIEDQTVRTQLVEKGLKRADSEAGWNLLP